MIRFLQSGNKAAKYLLGGMMLILVVSMCWYLIPGFMSGSTVGTAGVVATVGGQEITALEVQKTVTQIQRQQSQRGQAFPEAFLPYLRQQAVQQLLQAAEMRYAGDRMGLRVSDQEVREELRTNPMFAPILFPQGNWIGQEKYEELLREHDATVEDFESDVRSHLLQRKLVTAVTAGVVVSPSEIEKAYEEQNTKVKFDYAVLKMEDVEKDIKPTDAELKAFYDTHKNSYQNSIPEKRQVRYFLIPEKDAESKVTITPSDLERYYHDHQDEYRVPDRVKVRHILIRTPTPGPDGKIDQAGLDAARAKAADILKQVKAGGNFAELAKKYSEDPGTKDMGGEMEWFGKGQMVPEFEQTAFSLNKGQVSDLVKTTYGFHIIQTEDKETAHVKPFTEVKDSIEQTLKPQRVAEKLDQMANSAEADARSLGLDKAAAKYGAQVTATNPVARADALPGVGPNPAVMNAIFMTDEKAPVQSARTRQAAVIFQLEKVFPPRTPALEEIHERVVTDFKSDRGRTLLSKKTAELSDRAHSEHDLNKAARELGTTVKTSDLVGHSSQVPEVGSMSGPASAAFTLKQGEISGPLDSARNGFVLQVTQRQEPALAGDDFAKAQENLREQIAQQKQQEAMELFMSNLNDRLEKEGKIKVNKDEMSNLSRGRG
jgi:peptidyl-prolyl cis-trans isomerase D